MGGKTLAEVWADVDRCEGCRDASFAKPDDPSPARPDRPPPTHPILFLGEAPPGPGGFWQPGNGDAVRRLLLPSLPEWPQALDWDSCEATTWFVDAGYFFVHTMKWPLLHHSYGRLTPRSKRLAVSHAVEAHLGSEVELMAPSAIVALGAGAWDGCRLLASRYGGAPLGDLRITAARLAHHSLHLPKGRDISLHTTFLPGDINERLGGRGDTTRKDVVVFLDCIGGVSDCQSVQGRDVVAPNRSGGAAER